MGIVALIPAKSQSKRIPNKNIVLLNGHPLIAYSICSALDSKIFDRVIVSTDSKDYAWVAEKYGAEVIIRPPEYATEFSPDIEWVAYTLKEIPHYEFFSILRPTSPFRTKNTIKRAWDIFSVTVYDSLRAIELCSQHPYKMWRWEGGFIKPIIDSGLHSMPYQALPKIYVQNASLEIARTECVSKGSISGDKIIPFLTQGYEGFDINILYDLKYAEWLVETGQAKLPDVRTKS